jgi:hypothetical protein
MTDLKDRAPYDTSWVKKQDNMTEEEREKKRQKHQKLAEKFRKKQEAREKSLLDAQKEQKDEQ